ncbi:MAG: oxidoreductase [Bacteroidetes bacterium]|nr:oxidoreductase [Bacteroidota bacterium]
MPAKMKLFIVLSIFISIEKNSHAQKIEILAYGSKTSIRGLSVVNNKLAWASGSNGAVAKSTDGGKTWKWITVKNFEQRDFRDIEAFDSKTAIIMAVGEPALILKTNDGGETWKTVYADSAKGMFLDAMEFWNRDSGIVIGDPIEGKFFVARSFDGGNSWHKIPFAELPAADSGEACFAASGTNVRALGRGEACFVSGGLYSRIFIRDKKIDLPVLQGKSTTGANSVAVSDNRKLKGAQHLVVVGGDFSNDTSSEKNCAISNDGGKTWAGPLHAPQGYKSCVEFITKNNLIACGTSGVDISRDGGTAWQHISAESFHVCRKAKKGNAVFLAGANGQIARLIQQ